LAEGNKRRAPPAPPPPLPARRSVIAMDSATGSSVAAVHSGSSVRSKPARSSSSLSPDATAAVDEQGQMLYIVQLVVRYSLSTVTNALRQQQVYIIISKTSAYLQKKSDYRLSGACYFPSYSAL